MWDNLTVEVASLYACIDPKSSTATKTSLLA
jgi:hypothetical protein